MITSPKKWRWQKPFLPGLQMILGSQPSHQGSNFQLFIKVKLLLAVQLWFHDTNFEWRRQTRLSEQDERCTCVRTCIYIYMHIHSTCICIYLHIYYIIDNTYIYIQRYKFSDKGMFHQWPIMDNSLVDQHRLCCLVPLYLGLDPRKDQWNVCFQSGTKISGISVVKK